ncbi:hypothetical protein R5R35_009418 [Gryllus longicercus]|uniref:Dynein axonemal assembly factor 1 homolog n=1 Tax=Gryllus longicercus TaxID=2509291 RepID=A0AAN9VNZ6_9ORTH
MSVATSNIIHEEIEPGVINADMIIKSVLENCPKGELGRLIAEEGIVLEEVKELRLEFLNILRIDHLWMLDSLVILHISNNMIEKIENLERLVNLKELDLSFNNIEVIENLGTLVNLEVLTVFGNKIYKLENLENLKLLMIFSVGNNLLVDLENVMYLRPFHSLRALNMSGNPVALHDNFKEYVYTFLPQLVYYEYRMITQTEREMANIRFKDELKVVLEEESASKVEITDEEELKIHRNAFVENLNADQLFKAMFVDDHEGIALLKMNEETEELVIDFKDKFIAHCKEIFDFGLTQYKLRQSEIEQYESCVIDAKKTIMDKSREMMNEYIERKSEIFLEMRTIVRLMQAEAEAMEAGEDVEDHFIEYSERIKVLALDFQEKSHRLWQELMRMEMTLYEQIEESTSNFEVAIRELQTQLVENTQALFVKLREEENTYFEQLSDAGLKYMNTLNLLDDPTLELDPDLQNIMLDRDTMASAISGSHEIHVQVIDDRQDALTTKANNWTNDYFETLRKDEIKRNRGKIVEISHFMDLQQEEYEEILAATGIHIEEPGVEDGEDDEKGLAASIRAEERRSKMLMEAIMGDEEEEEEEGEGEWDEEEGGQLVGEGEGEEEEEEGEEEEEEEKEGEAEEEENAESDAGRVSSSAVSAVDEKVEDEQGSDDKGDEKEEKDE